MRPGLFGVSGWWPRKRTRGNDGTSLREQRNFSLSSVQFVGLRLPSNFHAEIWTRLHAPAISSHYWPSKYVLLLSLEWHVWSSSLWRHRGIFTLSHIASLAVFYRWTREYWQWRITPHTPDLQEWSLIITCSFVPYTQYRCLVGLILCGGYSQRIFIPAERAIIIWFPSHLT